MNEADLKAFADELVKRQRTVHERVACPTCHAPIGDRCVRKGTRARPIVWTGPTGLRDPWAQGMNDQETQRLLTLPRLKHSHAERLRADGIPLR